MWISLLRNQTFFHPIQTFEMTKDNNLDQAAEIKTSSYFMLQLHESTDFTSCAQSLVYSQYPKRESLKDDYLFSELLTKTTCG